MITVDFYVAVLFLDKFFDEFYYLIILQCFRFSSLNFLFFFMFSTFFHTVFYSYFFYVFRWFFKKAYTTSFHCKSDGDNIAAKNSNSFHISRKLYYTLLIEGDVYFGEQNRWFVHIFNWFLFIFFVIFLRFFTPRHFFASSISYFNFISILSCLVFMFFYFILFYFFIFSP